MTIINPSDKDPRQDNNDEEYHSQYLHGVSVTGDNITFRLASRYVVEQALFCSSTHQMLHCCSNTMYEYDYFYEGFDEISLISNLISVFLNEFY